MKRLPLIVFIIILITIGVVWRGTLTLTFDRIIVAWPRIESNITERPTYHNQELQHAGVWLPPHTVQLIGNNHALVQIEDSNTVHTLVLTTEYGRFKIVETYTNTAQFPEAIWLALVNMYGDPAFKPETYTISFVQDGELVSFTESTRVEPNVFIEQY